MIETGTVSNNWKKKKKKKKKKRKKENHMPLQGHCSVMWFSFFQDKLSIYMQKKKEICTPKDCLILAYCNHIHIPRTCYPKKDNYDNH